MSKKNKFNLVLVKKRSIKKFFVKFLALFTSLAFIFTLILGAIFYQLILKDLPNPAVLKNSTSIPYATRIYDRNGVLLHEVYLDENRSPVKLQSISPYAIKATIAIEDKDFYTHQGVSIYGGILRAAKENFINKNASIQGGSTITQQLVKSALLSRERTIKRKLREIVLAIWAENIFSKDEILELYLNQVPYGGVAYGIESASKTYFSKPSRDLTLAQSAYLAGLPQAPSLYSPHGSPDKASARQKLVLKAMYDQKMISPQEYTSALAEDIKISPPTTNIKAPHFVFYVKALLEKQFDLPTVSQGGLKVVTTLDYPTQQVAETSVVEEVDKVKRLLVSNGAALVTRPSTGEILAMVGSKDFFATGTGWFNVTTALRQPGSSIKPINYAIGLDRKIISPASIIVDTPTCFKQGPGQKPYCPKNYDGKFHGPVTIRSALANSYNIPAVKMLALNTVKTFTASAPAFLISTLNDSNRFGLALTLGGGEVPMIEMAQAFSAFSNEGTPKPVISILSVEDRFGNKLYEYKDPNFIADIHAPLDFPNFLSISGKKAISREAAFLISHILLDNPSRSQAFGLNSQLVVKDKTVSVKTGTSNEKRDNWTIGYTPNFLAAVWVGNNDNSPMHQNLASGVTGAAPIWNRIMTYLLSTQPDLFPRKPDGITSKGYCKSAPAPEPLPDGTVPPPPPCENKHEFFIRGTEKLTGYIKSDRHLLTPPSPTPAP